MLATRISRNNLSQLVFRKPTSRKALQVYQEGNQEAIETFILEESQKDQSFDRIFSGSRGNVGGERSLRRLSSKSTENNDDVQKRTELEYWRKIRRKIA